MVAYLFEFLLAFMEINVASCPMLHACQAMQQSKHVTPVEFAKEKPWLEEPTRSRAVDAVIHNLSNQLPAFVRRRGQVTNQYLVPRGLNAYNAYNAWRSFSDLIPRERIRVFVLEINSLQMTFDVSW